MDNIKDRLRSVIVKSLRLSISPEELVEENLVASYGIDSITSLEVLIWVENEFNITVEDQDLTPKLIDSLDSLESYIKNRASSNTAGEV